MKNLVTAFLLVSVLALPACAADELGASTRAELAIGAQAPSFALTNAADGKQVRFEPAGGSPSVVVFMCNTCPYAKAFEDRVAALARDYAAKGVKFYSVNSSKESMASESLEEMKKRAAEKAFPFAYLKDGDSAVARAYGARVTPHVYLVDGKGVVRYRGYVDDSAKASERTHEGLVQALDAVLAGKPVEKAETKAFGCTIKFAGS